MTINIDLSPLAVVQLGGKKVKMTQAGRRSNDKYALIRFRLMLDCTHDLGRHSRIICYGWGKYPEVFKDAVLLYLGAYDPILL